MPGLAVHAQDLSSATALPRLTVSRAEPFFRKANGERFSVIGASDFNLFARHLMGEDVRPIIQDRKNHGFNLLRVWLSYNVCPTIDRAAATCNEPADRIGRLIPRHHDRYFEKITEFATIVASFGLYLELTAFAFPFSPRDKPVYERPFLTDDEEVRFWNAVVRQLRPLTNVILELTNENEHADAPLLPLARLARPTGVLASHGSNGSGATPVRPYWDYVDFHTNDNERWERLAGEGCYELFKDEAVKRPCLASENTRSDRPLFDGRRAAIAAKGAALLAAGAVFHSPSGKSSEVFTAEEAAQADRWVAGARSIPLECQALPVVRVGDDRYERMGDSRCVVEFPPISSR